MVVLIDGDRAQRVEEPGGERRPPAGRILTGADLDPSVGAVLEGGRPAGGRLHAEGAQFGRGDNDAAKPGIVKPQLRQGHTGVAAHIGVVGHDARQRVVNDVDGVGFVRHVCLLARLAAAAGGEQKERYQDQGRETPHSLGFGS